MTAQAATNENPLAGTERFEVKFTGPGHEIDTIDSWIRMHAAGFTRPYPPRVVNSVYFDTYSLAAFEENLIGASEREKVRLRWYGLEGEADRSTLEVKQRRNKLGWKLSYPITGAPSRDESWRDLRARVRSQIPDEARARFDHNPMVSLVNQYRRSYYLSGDGLVRLTVDTNLKAFDQRFGRKPNFDRSVEIPDMLVIEFKFSPEDRPNAMQMMQSIPLRVSRSSKYATAVALIAET